MTIVVLTLTFDGRDGLSCLSRQVTRALRELYPGAAVEVISLAGSDTVPSSPALAGCGGSRPRLARRAVAAAARRPALVVTLHAHLLPLALPFLAAGTALAHVLVGVEAWRPLSRLQAEALERTTSVVAISRHTRRRFVEHNPAWGSRPIAVCHPCTPDLPSPDPRLGTPLPGYALIVGRMAAEERYKGHDLLIDIWPQVRAEAPGARLVVAGDGDDAPRLRSRVAEAGLGEQVQFTGPVADDELAALYANAGCLVLPSVNEGFGYAFLEAMASGRACIGARGAAEEIIDDGATGLIVDGGDGPSLARAIVRLLMEPDEAHRMGEAGRRRASSLFAPERFRNDLAAALEPVLAC